MKFMCMRIGMKFGGKCLVCVAFGYAKSHLILMYCPCFGLLNVFEMSMLCDKKTKLHICL